MRYRGALLLFIFILFFTLASNTEKCRLIENAGSETGNQVDGIKACEIIYNNSGGVYRDGLVGNLDYFKNKGYAVRHSEDRAFVRSSSKPPGCNMITVY